MLAHKVHWLHRRTLQVFQLKAAMRLSAILHASALVLLGVVARAADVPTTPTPVARGASQAGGAVSPAVRAAENAEVPGDVRPEKRAVPQISIPLKGKRSRGAAASADGGNGVDDAAARCLAKKTKRERVECQRAGSRVLPEAAKQ